MDGRSRSWTRKYYCEIDERSIKCKICHCYLRKSFSNRGNIHRHIKLKHPYIYFNEVNSKTLFRDEDSEDNTPIAQVFFIKDLEEKQEQNDESQEDEPLVSYVDNDVDEIPEGKNIKQPVGNVSEVELKVKRKFHRVETRRHKTKSHRWYSWTRKYFNRVNEKFIRCKICRKSFKTNITNNGNIRRHIKKKHSDVYNKETYEFPKDGLPDSDDSDAKESNKEVKKASCLKDSDTFVPQDINTEGEDTSTIDESIQMLEVEKTELNMTTKGLKNSLCEKPVEKTLNPMGGRRNRSWTRKYYQKVNDKLLKCIICQRLLKMNIHRHIRIKHPGIYLKENPVGVESATISVDEEEKIRAICEKSAEGMSSNKSCIWNFFEVIEQERLYKCSFCEKPIAIFPKNVHNLRRHIATCHKQEYQIMMKYGNVEPWISNALDAASDIGAVSSVEIAFLSVDDDGGKYKCSCCEQIIESKEEEGDAVLIQHFQTCQKKPEDGADATIIANV